MAKNFAKNTVLSKGFKKWTGGQARIIRALTCGRDVSHPYLKPRLEGDKIVLVCPQPGYGYTQERIPKVLLRDSLVSTGGVTVLINKSAWRALLAGEDVAILQVYTRGKLHHEFGDHPEQYVKKVRITPVED